jgi:AcrR family transcriptional regulator
VQVSAELPISAEATSGRVRGRRTRTQAERRAETRAALLEATIESLVTYGYAGTTTGRVAELAGMSRGAQLPYFPTRAELLGAAVSWLAEKRIAAAEARFTHGPVSIEQALDVLWEEHQGPVFHAALELWVASRSDPELSAAMHTVEQDVARRIAEVAELAIGELARRPGFGEELCFVLATIMGLALLQISLGSSVDALWEQARERLVDELSRFAT